MVTYIHVQETYACTNISIALDKALFFNQHFFYRFLISQKKKNQQKNICCGYSLEAPHRGASKEYSQHMFLWRNKKIFPDTPYLELCYSHLHVSGLVVLVYIFLFFIRDLKKKILCEMNAKKKKKKKKKKRQTNKKKKTKKKTFYANLYFLKTCFKGSIFFKSRIFFYPRNKLMYSIYKYNHKMWHLTACQISVSLSFLKGNDFL